LKNLEFFDLSTFFANKNNESRINKNNNKLASFHANMESLNQLAFA
jgi:hypothetical protein